jgi:hypothetical protein
VNRYNVTYWIYSYEVEKSVMTNEDYIASSFVIDDMGMLRLYKLNLVGTESVFAVFNSGMWEKIELVKQVG